MTRNITPADVRASRRAAKAKPVTMRDFMKYAGELDPGRYISRLMPEAQDAFTARCKGTKYWNYRPDDAFISIAHRLVHGDPDISYAECFGTADLAKTQSVIAGTIAELDCREAFAFPNLGRQDLSPERFRKMIRAIVGGRA